MKTQNNQRVTVTEQNEALGLYLEALFTEELPIEEQVEVSEIEEVKKPTPIPGRPDWSLEPFQTLLIDIDGMEVAIPLTSMRGISNFPDQLRQMPNSADWMEGIHKHHGKNIQVVNAHKLLIPENKREIENTPQPEFIVQIGSGDWGLACHSADRVVTVEPEGVRWSGAERNRPWLLGIIKEQLCALLDVDEFIDNLESQESLKLPEN